MSKTKIISARLTDAIARGHRSIENAPRLRVERGDDVLSVPVCIMDVSTMEALISAAEMVVEDESET